MTPLKKILNQHSRALPTSRESYAETVEELSLCGRICTSCADACVGEVEELPHLVRCIRIALDCADICGVTARLLTRQTETDHALLRAQLHACALACELCADECFAHASVHAHCASCANACRSSQECCSRMLAELDLGETMERDTLRPLARDPV